MNMTHSVRIAAGFGLLLPALGCATIMGSPRSNVMIESNPPGAHVEIQDHKGKEVASVNTPAVVKLDRSVSMLKPAHYTAIVEAPGYQPQKIDVAYTVNPWILGDILLGSVAGLVADDASGAMWKPKQAEYAVQLKPGFNAANQAVTLPVIRTPNSPAGQLANSQVEQAAYYEPALTAASTTQQHP